jgi:hypothetical protein
MSDTGNTDNSQAVQSSSTTQTAASATASTSTASTANSGAGYTSSTQIDSLSALEKKAPKVYRAMMEGIATNICNKMKASADRLKKMIREASNR